MRTFLVFAACIAAVAFVATVAPKSAEAGPVWNATLSSNDAGSTQTLQLTAKKCYCVQPTVDAQCVHLDVWDAGSLAADCTKDLTLDSTAYTTNSTITNRGRPFCFDSASFTAIVARQTDGGAVNLNLYNLYTNPTVAVPNCSVEVLDRNN